MRLGVFAFFMAGAVFAQEAAVPARHAAPDDASAKQAVETVRNVFRPEFQLAVNIGTKARLARQLIQVSNKSTDRPIDQYALLLEAIRLAVEANDQGLSAQALGRLESQFVGDFSTHLLELVEPLARAARKIDEHQAAAEFALQFAPLAMSGENFENAKKLLKLAKDSARKGRATDLIKRVVALEKALQQVQADVAAVGPVRAALQANPQDAAANLALGRYWTLIKGDWAQGLPHLAAGGDGPLQNLARADLAAPQGVAEQFRLADQEWVLAETQNEPYASHLQIRAGKWYALALPNTQGADRQRAVDRIRVCQTLTGERPARLTSNACLASREPAYRQILVAEEGGTEASEEAVSLALQWLAAHQQEDGSWIYEQEPDISRKTGTVAPKQTTTGTTGLGLLAFLGAGQTHKAGDYQEVVKRGLAHLGKQILATANGGDLSGIDGTLDQHGQATLALCEAYAITRDPELAEPTQLAVNFTVNAQDRKRGGWGLKPGEGSQTLALGWQLSGLKTATWGDLQVPPATIAAAARFLNSTEMRGGQFGYNSNTYDSRMNMTTASGLLCRIYLGGDRASLKPGIDYLVQNAQREEANVTCSFLATQVLFHWGGEQWKTWNATIRDRLVSSQFTTVDFADTKGSWRYNKDNVKDRSRLYRTVLNTLTLEIYYRHVRELQE